MTTLVTGGTGKTGLPLARLLLNSNQPFLLASRSGSAPEPFTGKGVRFDFFDKSTYENPFKADSNIDRAYIVNPVMDDPYEPVTAFIDFAKSKGVKRFVLLLGTPFTKVHTSHGRIWGHLENLGVEYTVLNATYFTENISTVLRTTIRDMNSIITAAGDGKVPFVGVDDVAQAAYDALFAENSPNTDYIVIGPSLYSYDEVAAMLTQLLGRKITHVRLTANELLERAVSKGFPPVLARILVSYEEDVVATGKESALVGKANTITGTCELKEFLEENKSLWVV